MNEKSLLLAQDLLKNDSKRKIVFTNINMDSEEQKDEIYQAKKMRCLLFEKGNSEVNFDRHASSAAITFFLFESDEQIFYDFNHLIHTYGKRKRTNLYLFADSRDSALLLGSIDTLNDVDITDGRDVDSRMLIRRIDETLAFVTRFLYEQGHEIFESADTSGTIRFAVVGLGKIGNELLKTLSWYGQMTGYHLCIDGYDANQSNIDRIYAECPELMSEKYNGKQIDGEAQYKITLHHLGSTISENIAETVAKSDPTYVFIDLDDDSINIHAAEVMRTILLRHHCNPVIKAMVRNVDKNERLQSLKHWKWKSGCDYNIQFVGSKKESFSENVIINSILEKQGLAVHLGYCGILDEMDSKERLQAEQDFWRFEYNYRSSIASALHRNARVNCKIFGSHKPVTERSEYENNRLLILEHQRWNAYMRSIGYCYAAERNDLAKTHHLLVPFDCLSDKDKAKNSVS